MVAIKFRDVRKRLRKEGWYVARQESSHEQWKHPDKPAGRVSVAGKDGNDVKPGTLKSICEQAEWEKQ